MVYWALPHLLVEPRKIFVRFSGIRLFANIRTIRFNTSQELVLCVRLHARIYRYRYLRSKHKSTSEDIAYLAIRNNFVTNIDTTFIETVSLSEVTCRVEPGIRVSPQQGGGGGGVQNRNKGQTRSKGRWRWDGGGGGVWNFLFADQRIVFPSLPFSNSQFFRHPVRSQRGKVQKVAKTMRWKCSLASFITGYMPTT